MHLFLQQQSTAAARETAKTKLSLWGSLELCFGVFIIIIAALSLSLENEKYHSSCYDHPISVAYLTQGLWTGAISIISGISGIIARSKPTVAIYKANLVFSISSFVAGSAGLTLVIIEMNSSWGECNYMGGPMLVPLVCNVIFAIAHISYCWDGGSILNCGSQQTDPISHPGLNSGLSSVSSSQSQEMTRIGQPRDRIVTAFSTSHPGNRTWIERAVIRTSGYENSTFTESAKPPSYREVFDSPPPYESLRK